MCQGDVPGLRRTGIQNKAQLRTETESEVGMSDVQITAMGPRQYGVQVREGDVETSHRVTVPDSLIDDLQLAEGEEETLVRESFAFLLEREPATAILKEFALPTISDYFPEYLDEVKARLA